MEPTDYDKIVDKLMQFRNKLPRDHLRSRRAKVKSAELRQDIMELLLLIDEYAALDEQGWIK